MMSIIKNNDRSRVLRSAAFNFDDIGEEAQRGLDKVRAEADSIIAHAREESQKVRRQAEQQGREEGLAEVAQMVDERVEKSLQTLLPALSMSIRQIEESRDQWLKHWEKAAVQLACAIAARVIRREVEQVPEITLALVSEALELASGSPNVRLSVNPQDHETLGAQITTLTERFAQLAPVEIVSDPNIAPGESVVETRCGKIDQRFDAQLARIEEELV